MEDIPEWQPASMLVEEVMTRDVFTVQKDDIIQLVTDMMDEAAIMARYTKLLSLAGFPQTLQEMDELNGLTSRCCAELGKLEVTKNKFKENQKKFFPYQAP